MKLHNCILDWKRTLYDPDKDELINGAIKLLDLFMLCKVPCVLIGKGGSEMEEKVKELGLKKYFTHVQFSGSEKSPRLFTPFIHATFPASTLVIGDRARAEIEIGNTLGATTIWVKQGKFAEEEPLNADQEAKYVVKDLEDLYSFIKMRYGTA